MKVNVGFFMCLIIINFVLFSCNSDKQRTSKVETQEIEVRRIWKKSPYNAFTDIIWFKGNFYCAFREGSGHVPGENGSDGEIRILKSQTGDKWESTALLKKAGVDLRDPKLSITPDDRLMVLIGGSVYKGDSLLARYPYVSFSNTDGTGFAAPRKIKLGSKITNNYDWIWRVTWHNDIGYGVNYQISPKEGRDSARLFLVTTNDGENYSLAHEFDLDGFPNESTIRFDRQDKMYILIRRESADKKGILAKSSPPYRNWTFQKLAIRLGGPNFLFLNQKEMILGTRIYNEPNSNQMFNTSLLLTDLDGKIDTTIQLKSGDDTSYPGLLIYNDTLWVTYYSNHQDNHTSIYLAKIPINRLEEEIK